MNRKILFTGVALLALSGMSEVIPVRAVAHRGLWDEKVAAAGLTGFAEMEPLVPYMWRKGEVGAMVRDLREVSARTGLRRFYVAGPGFNEVMYAPFATNLYAEMGREIGEVRTKLEPLGVEVNWWCAPSIRYVSDFASVEDAWGGKSADNKKCPLDPAFQADWAAKVKDAVAAARPRIVNVEDDFTLSWGRGLRGGACFCQRHLALFAEIYGKPLTGPEIAAASARWTVAGPFGQMRPEFLLFRIGEQPSEGS